MQFEPIFVKEDLGENGMLNHLPINHKSMSDLRPREELQLADCIRAFSASEQLDDGKLQSRGSGGPHVTSPFTFDPVVHT